MQTIIIAGRIGKDADLRNTPTGDSVCNFSVAVDQRKGHDTVTNWWRVSLWGKRGEALAQYLKKGSSVTVQGEFTLDEYEGKPRLNIRANEIALQGGKSDNQQERRQEPERNNYNHNNSVSLDDDDASIPF